MPRGRSCEQRPLVLGPPPCRGSNSEQTQRGRSYNASTRPPLHDTPAARLYRCATWNIKAPASNTQAIHSFSVLSGISEKCVCIYYLWLPVFSSKRYANIMWLTHVKLVRVKCMIWSVCLLTPGPLAGVCAVDVAQLAEAKAVSSWWVDVSIDSNYRTAGGNLEHLTHLNIHLKVRDGAPELWTCRGTRTNRVRNWQLNKTAAAALCWFVFRVFSLCVDVLLTLKHSINSFFWKTGLP